MLSLILQSRVKFVIIGIFFLFIIIVFLSIDDTSEEEAALSRLKRRNPVKAIHKERPNEQKGSPDQNHVPNFDVKFYSGKGIADILDGEKKPYQVHKIKIENLSDLQIRLDCEDRFSKFGQVIPNGGSYDFSVTDLFAKRHYWCKTSFGSAAGAPPSYKFKAYGEGAPRDNNVVVIRKDGAFINGKSVTIVDT